MKSAPRRISKQDTLAECDQMQEWKVAQKFTKAAQKVAIAVFNSTGVLFKIAEKVTKYLGYFCKKFYCQNYQKTAQSGHADFLSEQIWRELMVVINVPTSTVQCY